LRESNIPEPISEKNILTDSQPLEKSAKKIDKNSKDVKRIVFFYTDGTFETFEN